MRRSHIGEFEQLVLLALLQCQAEPYAPNIRQVLEERSGRSVSRGALYRTLDRLAKKGLLRWELEDSSPVPERGGHPMLRYQATEEGRRMLKVSRETLLSLWDGIEAELEGA